MLMVGTFPLRQRRRGRAMSKVTEGDGSSAALQYDIDEIQDHP